MHVLPSPFHQLGGVQEVGLASDTDFGGCSLLANQNAGIVSILVLVIALSACWFFMLWVFDQNAYLSPSPALKKLITGVNSSPTQCKHAKHAKHVKHEVGILC